MGIGAVGSNAQFGFAEETTWASGTPTIDNFIPFLSESIQLERNIVTTDAIRGASSRSIWRTGAESVGGDLSVEIQPTGMNTLFKHTLGRASTAGPSGSGFYVHKIFPSGVLPEGLAIEVGRTGSAGGTFTYRGMKVNQMSLNCSVGEPLTATFSFLGKLEEQSQADPTTVTSISSLNPLTFDEGAITIDGTSQEVQGFSLTVNNNLIEDKGTMGSVYRAAIPRSGFRDVNGSLNLEFDDLGLYNKYVNGTTAALKFSFTSDDLAVTGKAYSLVIDCPKVVFTGSTPTVSGPDLIFYDQPFISLYDDDQGNEHKEEIRITAVSAESSI